MTTVTILGAGAMGSALATPLRANGHETRLWGTWLDDFRIDALESGQPHPGTNVPAPEGLKLYRSEELEAALDGADAVVISVASVGVHEVTRRAAPFLDGKLLMLTSKGFHTRTDGSIGLMPEAVREALGEPERELVSIGGPCKANEVAAGRFTATLFASQDAAALERSAGMLGTADYRIEQCDDETGLEVAAPLKNVFAIALGFADGLHERTGESWHNLKSALFAQSVREMSALSAVMGGREATAYGLAGVGDLEVTGLSGRNKVFGSRVGAGETVPEAREAMAAAGLTVEGLDACRLSQSLVKQLWLDAETLPLLTAITAVLYEDADPYAALTGALNY
jgi:glycerol-3-phosphate dehydrogenase (NAD(P)+)